MLTRGSERRARAGGLAPRSRRLALLLLAALAAGGCRRPSGGDLSVGLATGLAQLDPHLENTVSSIEQLANVYEPLVSLDGAMRAQPCLASSWSTPDATTWVFRLRPGVTFHDGSALGAPDVVYSLTRPLGDPRLTIASYLGSVREAVATAPDTVVVRTREPDALLLPNLSFVPIVREGSTTESLQGRPDGTGPFRVESFEPGRELRLRRHDRYWGPRPDFAGASLRTSVTDEEAAAGLAAGRWDVLRSSGDGVMKLVRAGNAYEEVRFPNVFLRHLAFDVERDETPFCPGVPNPFRKAAVREAIGLALDRAAIARSADVDSLPASQLVPPAIFGFDPSAPPAACDPDRARALLAEAGYPQGFDVVLHRSGFGAAAEEVKAQLARIGVRVELRLMRGPDLFAALDRRELSFWLAADGCMTGDALELLLGSFRSRTGPGLGIDNYGGFSDADLDRKIDAARRQLEPVRRLPLLRGALADALAANAWIPLYYTRDALVVRRTIDFRPRADGLLRLAELRRPS